MPSPYFLDEEAAMTEPSEATEGTQPEVIEDLDVTGSDTGDIVGGGIGQGGDKPVEN
jgi:hypothetical protein